MASAADSVLPPGQTLEAPSALLTTMGLGIGVAFKSFQDVVRLQTQFSGPLGCSNGADSAATQQHEFLAIATQ